MHRIDAAGHVGNQFVDGNPGGGIAGTLLEEHWHNAVQEELVTAILTRAGITLVKGTWTQLAAAMDQLTILPGGRLTLEAGVPVSTADQAGKTTVYYTPHRHNRIALYNGSVWLWRTFSEMSQATSDATKSPAAVANNSNYDVFVWLDSGTMRATRGPAWSSDTARGTGAGTTELEFFEGRWANKVAITNGPAARCGLYVGTIRSDGAAAINDVGTGALRHVWNTHWRVPRPMVVLESTNTWAYLTGTLRQANANTANQLDYVVGLSEDAVSARVIAASSNTDAGAAPRNVGIGVDSTTVDSSKLRAHAGTIANVITPHEATYDGYPGLGRHLLVWLEQGGGGVGATTWYGDNGGTYLQSGITGQIYG